MDVAALSRGLKVAATALNDGDLGRAMVATLHLRMTNLDTAGAKRIADADAVRAKYDPNQPRDWHGRWTTEGDAVTPSGAPSGEPAREWDRPEKVLSGPALDADFYFPIDEHPRDTGSEILRRSVERLDAEYGYYIVRDDLAAPFLYFSGFAPPLDLGRARDENGKETWDWYRYVSEGHIWTDPFPLLRDLYEVNLISERHTSVRTALGYITDWITADQGRGRLEDLGRGRLLWTLTDQEMFEVRPVLNEARLLKSCRDRIYRDLHPGTGVKPYADPRCYPPMLWRPKPT
jgi:hypothetical protein